MAVLTLLLASLLIYRAAGALGLYWLNSWQAAARCALSTTLLVNRERAFYTDA